MYVSDTILTPEYESMAKQLGFGNPKYYCFYDGTYEALTF